MYTQNLDELYYSFDMRFTKMIAEQPSLTEVIWMTNTQ